MRPPKRRARWRSPSPTSADWIEHLDRQGGAHLLPVEGELLALLIRLGRRRRALGDREGALATLTEAAALAEGGERTQGNARTARTLAEVLRELSELVGELGNVEAERASLTRGGEAARAAVERRSDEESEALAAWFASHAPSDDPER